MWVRVHEKRGGKVYQLPFVCDGNSVADYPVTNRKPLNEKQLIEENFFIIDNQNQKNMSVNQMVANKYMAPAVGIAEKPQGQIMTYREEVAGVGAIRRVLNIEITNTEATTESVVLGDWLGFIKRQTGIGVPKAGITFGGTYGATSYDDLQKLSASVALRCHSIKFQGYTSAGIKSDLFFATGSFQNVEIDALLYNIDAPQTTFVDLVDQNSFNTNIRTVNDYRFLFTPLSGWIVTLPTLTKVTISLDVISYEGGHSMTYFQ